MPRRPSPTTLARLLALFCLVSPSLHAQTPLPAPTITASTYAPLGANPNYVRFGAPITLSGRILPADATGTLTFLIDGVPVQTLPLATQTLGDYTALGDSITYAGYIADPTQRYPALLAQSLNLIPINRASPGYVACQVMPVEILPNNIATTPATSPLYSLLIGTNDVAYFGPGSHEAVFNNCHQATLAWLGVGRSNKVLIGDPSVAPASGAWTTALAPGSATLNALTNTTGSGSISFTLTTTGAPAYLWYVLQSASSGSFTVSVDGGPASTPIPTQLTSSDPSLADSYGLLRLTVAPGAHTFDIAAQSGTVSILAMAAPPTAAGPTVLAGDVPSQIIPNAFNANSTAIDTYTADIQSNIALLHADGLDIRFAPTRNFMFATPAEMMDDIHPNALGLSELAQAFESVITPTAPAPDTTTAATAAFTTSAIPIGSHTVDIHYSGDSHYAPTDAGFNLTIYDGATTATLTADAAIYPTQSPIILTATIPQPNTTGLVIFTDETGPIGSAWMNQINLGQAQLTLPSLPAGTHTLTAQYQGDVQFNGSSSAPVTITVSGAYTTTSLSTPATRYFAATPIPLTATVTPTSATGTVTFADGATILGTSTLVSGIATFTASTLAAGIHTLTATFNGNATQDSSTSPTLSVEIDPNSTTVALRSLPATIPYGTTVSLAATVSPSAATGTVTFTDGTLTLGTSPLANGVATLSVANLAIGLHTFTATYSGDANDLTSTATPITTQITLATTTIALTPIPASEPYATPIPLTATVTAAASTGPVTGSVTFTDSVSGTLGQATLANSTATLTTPITLSPGLHTFTAAYTGDAVHAPATPTSISTTIAPLPAAIALAPLPATAIAGDPITLTATIAPSSATGTVLFRDTTLGVLGQSTVAHGTATLTLPYPATGSYSITATYSGDANFGSATSAAVITQVVLGASNVVLASSANPTPFAAPITITATISPASATGTITFYDGPNAIATSLIANAAATLTTANLAPGAHTLHASYPGNAVTAPLNSAAITQTVTLDPTTTTLTLAQNPVTAAAILAFNIRVTSSNTNPTGTVSVRSGATTLASGTLANASGDSAYATLTLPAATLGLGQFPIAAFYSGNSGAQPSDTTAAPIALTVTTIPTNATLTLSTTQIPVGSAATLTASISPITAGSITFLNGTTPLAIVPLTASGTAAYTFTSSTAGAFPITAAYTATGLYAASTSATQTLTVTAPLSATLNPASITAGPGATATANLTLTPLSGFTGPILATCKTAAFITCSLTPPATLTAPATIPVQIGVAKTTAALAYPITRSLTTIALALLLPILTRRKPRRTLRLAATVIALFAAITCINGCAEGGTFNDIPAGPQTVTITVTAAATPITATLTLNITD